MGAQPGTPVQTVCQLQYRSLGPNSGGQSGGSRPFPSLHPRPRFLGGPPPRRVGPQAPRTAPTRPRCPPCRAAPSRPPSAPPCPRWCPGLAPWLVVFGGGVLLLFSSFGLGGGRVAHRASEGFRLLGRSLPQSAAPSARSAQTARSAQSKAWLPRRGACLPCTRSCRVPACDPKCTDRFPCVRMCANGGCVNAVCARRCATAVSVHVARARTCANRRWRGSYHVLCPRMFDCQTGDWEVFETPTRAV